MTDEELKQAIAELQEVVRCRCDEAYRDRGLKDPHCECDSAEAVKIVADRIEALTKERDAALHLAHTRKAFVEEARDERDAFEAKLAKAVEALGKIAKYDHQRRAADAIRYHLPSNNTAALREVLMTIASTDIQAWATSTLAEISSEAALNKGDSHE